MSEHDRSVLVPLAYRIEDAAAAIGISRSTLFEHIKDGRIPSRKIGNSTVIRRCDLEAFLDAAPLSAATKAAQKANGNQSDPTALGQLGIRGADDGTAILPQAPRSGAKTDTARSVVPFQTAARELGLSAATLRRMCRTGRGPTLLRLSERRLGIRRGDLDAWKANREMPVGRTHVPANDAGHKRSRRES